MKCASLVFLLLALLAASTADAANPSPTPAMVTSVNEIAEAYVKLVLALGQHDADYVDAYYGPPEWKKEAAGSRIALDDIGTRAKTLLTDLARQRGAAAVKADPKDDMTELRHHYLERQLSALSARVRMLKGERLSFDDESRALYDAAAPTYPESHFQEILNRLEKRVPGSGPLVERYDAFRRAFVIPRDKLDPVFQKAIQACRERTLRHVTLPAD